MKALGVIDMEVDFCEGGRLPIRGGKRVARDIFAYLNQHASEYALVFATKDWHIDPGSHWSDEPDFVDSWPVHCEAGTSSTLFQSPLTFSDFQLIFYKGLHAAAYSGFEGTTEPGGHGYKLHEVLTRYKIDELDLCGLAFDYCVGDTGISGVGLGYRTNILANLTAAVHHDRKSVRETILRLQKAGVNIK